MTLPLTTRGAIVIVYHSSRGVVWTCQATRPVCASRAISLPVQSANEDAALVKRSAAVDDVSARALLNLQRDLGVELPEDLSRAQIECKHCPVAEGSV